MVLVITDYTAEILWIRIKDEKKNKADVVPGLFCEQTEPG